MNEEESSDGLEDINFDEMETDLAKFASEPSVRSVLEVGVDLQNYSSSISEELKETQQNSIKDYLQQVSHVQELGKEIDSCDKTLETMENLLKDFQESLKQMSTDINTLQTKSQEITKKLNNRKEYEQYLGDFTRNLAITREFVNEVCNTEVGLQYLTTIQSLEEKIKYCRRKEVRDTNAAQEAYINLEKLKVKAAENIRKWMISRVTELITYPDTQMIIQDVLMRCHDLVVFLKENAADVDKFARNYYVDSLSRFYLEIFRNLARNVTQKMARISTQDETLVPVSQSRSFFSRRRTVGESTLFFSLGERYKLLQNALQPPQQFGEGSYPVEALLRSLYMRLVDCVADENNFSTTFWNDDSICTLIFSQTTKFLEQFLDELLPQITDPVCIVVLLNFHAIHSSELDKRRCFRIDQHMSNVHRKLCARFRQIIARNITALENCDLSILTDTSGSNGTGQASHHTNALTRRFAEFAASMTKLLTKDNIEIVAPELHNISSSVIDLFDRSSKQFKNPETPDIFLINNYFLIISTLRTMDGSILLDLFQRKLNESINHYVEIVLLIHFNELATVVRKAFTNIETREEPITIDFKEDELKKVADSFSSRHVQEMKLISDSQIMKFCDFTNGRDILRQIAKRLVLYWTKFDQLVKYVLYKQGKRPQWVTMMLSAEQLVAQIRPMTEGMKLN